MGQWTEVTAAEVRKLPDGTRARLYGMMTRGIQPWVEGEVVHHGPLKTEVVVRDYLGIMHIPVRAYKNKFWAIEREG